MPPFSDRQLATVLAALRLAQTTANFEQEMADHFTDYQPLSDSEIDELCDQLNAATCIGGGQ